MHFVSACFDKIEEVKSQAQHFRDMYFVTFEAKCWEGTLEGKFGINVGKVMDVGNEFEG